jgi:hypothetical protein
MRSAPQLRAAAWGCRLGEKNENGESGMGNRKDAERALAIPDSPFPIPNEAKRAKPGHFRAQARLEFAALKY